MAYHRLNGNGGWRGVGAEFGVSGGMAYRIAVQGYEPRDARIRARLGLAAMKPAPVCEVCGEVHIKKNCPKSNQRLTGKGRGWRPRWMI